MSERLHEQLSALLDGELPAGEAELLLVRLQRDPALRATLARYTVAGDAIRIASLQAAAQVEPVASAGFAARISAAIEAEEQQQASVLAGMNVLPAGPALAAPGLYTSGLSTSGMAASPRRTRRSAMRRWLQPLGGVAVAAGVAGLALMVLPHGPVGSPVGSPTVQIAAAPVATPAVVVATEPKALLAAAAVGRSAQALPGLDSTGEPASYTTPLSPSGPAPTFIPAAELASYVVAHSEVSGPLARRNVLTGLAAEPVPALAPGNPAVVAPVADTEPSKP
jgi:negative regulator of sigma E activity